MLGVQDIADSRYIDSILVNIHSILEHVNALLILAFPMPARIKNPESDRKEPEGFNRQRRF